MEEITNEVVETVETVEQPKTFTQEEVNSLIAKEKARAKKNSLSEEELTKFKNWQEGQKTEADKQEEMRNKLSAYESEKNTLAQENILLKKGVSADELEFVQFKVSKMEGDFEENLAAYLEENPKFIQKKKAVETIEVEDGVTAILKKRHPELF